MSKLMEDFKIEKWHKNVATNDTIKNKIHLPMIKLAGIKSLGRDGVVIDLGCGSAELIKNSADVSQEPVYIGLDISRDVLLFAKNNLKKAGFSTHGPIAIKNRGQLDKIIKSMQNQKGKRCILLKRDLMKDDLIFNTADIAFLLFPQFSMGPKLIAKTLSFKDSKKTLQIYFKTIGAQLSMAVFQALKMAKIGGSVIQSLYAPDPKKQIIRQFKAVASYPFVKLGKYSVIKGRDIGEVILRGRYLKSLEVELDRLKSFTVEYIKIGEKDLIDEINYLGVVVHLLNEGEITFKDEKLAVILNGEVIPLER